MIEVGRICLKIAGRDARKRCVIVEVLDKTYVMIDGETRRRKCNISHLEPLETVIDIKKGADHKKVADAFSKIDIELTEKKSKTAAEKPKQQRKVKSN